MSTEAEGSVTNWFRSLREGDQDAAQPLWERYFARLVCLVRPRLAGLSQGPGDAEDVALSAFGSFCQATREGRFPDVSDRQDLWKILVVLSARKASNHRRTMNRRQAEVDLTTVGLTPETIDADLDNFVAAVPTPDQAALVSEQCARLLDILDQEDPGHVLRRIAVWKLEGYTNPEIAEKLGCAERTVGNRLKLIRVLWENPPRS